MNHYERQFRVDILQNDQSLILSNTFAQLRESFTVFKKKITLFYAKTNRCRSVYLHTWADQVNSKACMCVVCI